MAKRFSDLKKALKLLRNLNSPGTPVTAPSGSALGNFQDFINGTTPLTVNRSTESLPGSLDDVAINPFGVPLDAGNLVRVKFSQRVVNDGIGAVITACNHEEITGEIPSAQGFVPAKAIVRVPEGNVTNRTSGITGLPYKAKDAPSFTYPYGAKTGATHESVVRTAIAAAVIAANANNTVTFNSEEL